MKASFDKHNNPILKRVRKKSYIECGRCKINNLGKQMCPCPRGGCEAEIVGEIKTIRIITKFNQKTHDKTCKN
jgi:hypothetical protein